MPSHPLGKPPLLRFIFRLLVPSLCFFSLTLLLAKAIMPHQFIDQANRLPSSLTSSPIAYWFKAPQACLEQNIQNEFQKKQCNEYWLRATIAVLIVAAPIAATALFIIISLDMFRTFHQRIRRRIEKGKTLKIGMVTNPPNAPNDWFGWLCCMRTVIVEFSDHTQIRVYVSYNSEAPTPGQNMAIYEVPGVFGIKTYFALHYTPHMSVMG